MLLSTQKYNTPYIQCQMHMEYPETSTQQKAVVIHILITKQDFVGF